MLSYKNGLKIDQQSKKSQFQPAAPPKLAKTGKFLYYILIMYIYNRFKSLNLKRSRFLFLLM